jgi:hypothetical protein
VSLLRARAACVLGLLLAACGGLDNPDLARGEVSGQLTGGISPGAKAYAYALGHPETRAPIERDGSYTLAGVPLEATQVVVFDGETGIGVVPVAVKPASRSRAAARDRSSLDVARTVVAAARCSGGVSCAKTEFEVEGVALATNAPKGEVASLFPLPPGEFKVKGRAHGLRQRGDVPVNVSVEATLSVELEMEIEDRDSDKGCVANGCAGGLQCDGRRDGDGRCYQCTDDVHCGAGARCENRACVPDGSSGEKRSVCLPCASEVQCQPGTAGQPAACVPMIGGSAPVCTHGCTTSAQCPSGLACMNAICVAIAGCDGVLQAFGQTCTDDSTCSAALSDATCYGSRIKVPSGRDIRVPGYCTSRCTTDADCPRTRGFTCSAPDVDGKQWCVR